MTEHKANEGIRVIEEDHMKVWVVVEEDRGWGISVEGVFMDEAKANKACLSRQYVIESEIWDAIDPQCPQKSDKADKTEQERME